MKSLTSIIDWYGPYTFDEAKSAAKFDYKDGLYMVIGKTNDDIETHLQYVGLATALHKRISNNHHKIKDVVKDQTIWLGEVVSPRTPGKKIKVTDKMLDLAEWAHTYFLQIPLNEKKKNNPPDHEIVVYNRWWQKDYQTQYAKRPHKEWPDLIDYYGNDYSSKVVWFGQKQIVSSPSNFKPSSP